MLTRRRLALRIAACAGAVAAPGIVRAQSWPKGPLRILVPFDAASTPDLAARLIGERLATRLGTPVVVENHSGAAGNIGTDAVAKSAPDGQTIGVSIAGPLAINPMLFKKLPYHPATDLAPITIAVSQASVLIVGPKRLAITAKDLMAELKGGKANLSFASIGAGSISHLAMETLAGQTGNEFVHVPYRGSAAAVTAVMTGEVDMALLPAAAVMPQVKAGKVKALAVASHMRSPSLAQLPTFAEGGLPDLQADAWVGFIAPAKTAPDTLTRLHDHFVAILDDPALRERLHAQYMDPVGNRADEFKAVLSQDAARWKPVIEKQKISLD